MKQCLILFGTIVGILLMVDNALSLPSSKTWDNYSEKTSITPDSCVFNKNAGDDTEKHYSLFLIDGSIDHDIDPNRSKQNKKPKAIDQAYWKFVTASNGPLEKWMEKYGLPKESPSLTFGMQRNTLEQHWGDFLMPISDGVVSPRLMLPLDNIHYRRGYGLSFIAPFMAIQYLGQCNSPPFIEKLSFVTLTDNHSNKTLSKNISELTDIENKLHREERNGKRKLAEGEYGKANRWIKAVSQFYTIESTATALFPHQNMNNKDYRYHEGDQAFSFTDPTRSKVPMMAHLLEIQPREPLLMLNYFTPDHPANLKMTASGYSTNITFHPIFEDNNVVRSYVPEKLCAELISDDKVIRELSCVESNNTSKGLTVNLDVSIKEAKLNLSLRLNGTFHYSPKGDIALDLGLLRHASHTMKLVLISPMVLPDGTPINHEIMADYAIGTSQQEIISSYSAKEAIINTILAFLIALVVAGAVWYYLRWKGEELDKFPDRRLDTKIIPRQKIEDNRYPNMGMAIATAQFDYQNIEGESEVVLGNFELKNKAEDNGRGAPEPLHVEIKICTKAFVLNSSNELVENNAICQPGVLRLNSTVESEVSFTKTNTWVISLDLKKLQDMESVEFVNDQLVLRGVINASLLAKDDNVTFCIPITVKKVPYSCNASIKWNSQQEEGNEHA